MMPHARKININNIVYYWRVSGGKTRYIDEQGPDLQLMVQRDDGKTALRARFLSKTYNGDDDYPDWNHKATLGPRDVRETILFGLKNGWEPGAHGAIFDLNNVANKAQLDIKDYRL